MHECDLRDSAEPRRLTLELRPDEIYNLGGQSSVAASWGDPLGTLAASGNPVGVLLDAAWELQETHGVQPRVVQASSAEIFGQAAHSPQDEATPIAPVSPYGEALRLAASHETGGDYVIGTGIAHSVRDFVDAAFRAAGIDEWEPYVDIDQAFVRPADPSLQLADSSRARDMLGWAPTVEFDELVRRMVEADLSGPHP